MPNCPITETHKGRNYSQLTLLEFLELLWADVSSSWWLSQVVVIYFREWTMQRC